MAHSVIVSSFRLLKEAVFVCVGEVPIISPKNFAGLVEILVVWWFPILKHWSGEIYFPVNKMTSAQKA